MITEHQENHSYMFMFSIAYALFPSAAVRESVELWWAAMFFASDVRTVVIIMRLFYFKFRLDFFLVRGDRVSSAHFRSLEGTLVPISLTSHYTNPFGKK